jgi:hypothetical protein
MCALHVICRWSMQSNHFEHLLVEPTLPPRSRGIKGWLTALTGQISDHGEWEKTDGRAISALSLNSLATKFGVNKVQFE